MLAKSLVIGGIALALIPQTFSQTGFWGLPGCQQSCIFSMLDKHAALGCAWTGYGNPDIACLCSEPNFEYGVRDCILQSCAPEWDNYDNAYLQVCASTRAPSGASTTLSSSSSYLWPSGQSPNSQTPQTITIGTVMASTTDITKTITMTTGVTYTVTPPPVPAAPTWTSTVTVFQTVSPLLAA